MFVNSERQTLWHHGRFTTGASSCTGEVHCYLAPWPFPPTIGGPWPSRSLSMEWHGASNRWPYKWVTGSYNPCKWSYNPILITALYYKWQAKGRNKVSVVRTNCVEKYLMPISDTSKTERFCRFFHLFLADGNASSSFFSWTSSYLVVNLRNLGPSKIGTLKCHEFPKSELEQTLKTSENQFLDPYRYSLWLNVSDKYRGQICNLENESFLLGYWRSIWWLRSRKQIARIRSGVILLVLCWVCPGCFRKHFLHGPGWGMSRKQSKAGCCWLLVMLYCITLCLVKL